MAQSKKMDENGSASTARLDGSFFLRVPQEIRDKIYSQFFLSIRFTFGKRYISRIDSRRVVSVPNGLALLRSCRQVYLEVGKSWLGQVLFCFESPEAMLDKLANIPIETLSMIRHMRASGSPLMISFPDDDIFYRTSQALRLLPGLKLDTLTVLGTRGSEVCYETLDFLVKYSNGWKELYYLSHNSKFLSYKHNWFTWAGDPDADRYLRVPQPAGWLEDLEKRDGPGSGASVTIYRSTDQRRLGSVMNAATRVAFTQKLGPGQDATSFGNAEDSTLMASGEREKEVLVVVKRSRDADYEEKQGSPYHADADIRMEFPGLTWSEIKLEQDSAMPSSDELEGYFDYKGRDDEHAIVDEYSHVEDYVWPPLQFRTD